MRIERFYVPAEFSRFVKQRNTEAHLDEAIEFDPKQGKNHRPSYSKSDDQSGEKSRQEPSPQEAETSKKSENLVDIVA